MNRVAPTTATAPPDVVEVVTEVIAPWATVAISVGAALLLTGIISVITHVALRKRRVLRGVATRGRVPLLLALTSAGTVIGMSLRESVEPGPTERLVTFLGLALLILSIGWLITVVLVMIEVIVLERYRSGSVAPRRVAKIRTQVAMMRHVLTAAVWVLAVSGVLMLIPQVRAIGAGLLASAGILSVIAGLAVQSSLSNVFAGLQIAFSDSIRVEDTVLISGQRGTVEDITLTYVVIRTPDDRRVLVPSTFFTTTVFENWTRRSPELTAKIEIDLTWDAPIEAVRARARALVTAHPLWDGRECSVDVVDAVRGLQRVDILVSGTSAGELYRLRADIREQLIAELARDLPAALPAPVPVAETAAGSAGPA